jgi:hypothetical protein
MTKITLLIAAALLSCSAAHAQTSSGTKDCAPTTTQPGTPNGLKSGGSDAKPLTDKLAESGGVLCPPPAADTMRVPAPSTGSNMPVVPPPGSPGGDPTVTPK